LLFNTVFLSTNTMINTYMYTKNAACVHVQYSSTTFGMAWPDWCGNSQVHSGSIITVDRAVRRLNYEMKLFQLF